MKKFFTLLFAAAISFSSMAQGNANGKSKDKTKVKSATQGKNGTYDNEPVTSPQTTAAKSSKNQPAKVRAAFLRDYPNARNVIWSKYQGDWTATFNNGVWRSTAVYHANGDRRDTRTPITKAELPGTTWDRIFERDGVYPEGNVIRIQSPVLVSEIFRIASKVKGGEMLYVYYDASGGRVSYNY